MLRRLNFWWRYLRGHTPWDTGVTPPELTALADSLPPGRALDLGCGTGTNALYLAARGWQAVGVDFVPAAVAQARRKARARRLAAAFFVADVTRLDFLDGTFDLAVDIGCLHAVPPDGRQRYAAGLARLVRPGGVYLLYAFCPHERRGRSFGLTPEMVAALFAPAFQVESQVIGTDTGSDYASAWHWLRRTTA